MSDIILKAAVGTDADTVTLPPSVTAGTGMTDVLTGRRGSYKSAAVVFLPLADTPIRTLTTNSSSAI